MGVVVLGNKERAVARPALICGSGCIACLHRTSARSKTVALALSYTPAVSAVKTAPVRAAACDTGSFSRSYRVVLQVFGHSQCRCNHRLLHRALKIRRSSESFKPGSCVGTKIPLLFSSNKKIRLWQHHFPPDAAILQPCLLIELCFHNGCIHGRLPCLVRNSWQPQFFQACTVGGRWNQMQVRT